MENDDILAKYALCRVCGAKLDEHMAAFALGRFEQTTCSTECSKRETIERHACCEKAEMTPCVCMYSFKCPEHGERHIGTHD